jgi:hypothetical protein
VKVLTVRQPWASLIMAGVKAVENRSWPIRRFGRIGIHAATKPEGKGWDAILKDLGLSFGHGRTLTVCGRSAALPAWEELPLGSILGSVEVYDCREEEDLGDEWLRDPFVCGRWCWLLRNPRLLAKPYRCKGALSLWEAPTRLAAC